MKRVLCIAICAVACREPGPTGSGGDAARAGDAGVTWVDEQTIVLRIDDVPPPPLAMELDRQGLADLLGETARDIDLMAIDPTVLLTSTLNEIKNACGTAWQLDSSDPQHDCSLTTLGQTFAGPDGTWQTSAEYALVRILTTTPANTVVAGTSIEGLQEIADLLNIGGGFGQILSDSLGIPRTEAVISTEPLVEALKSDFLATHPAMGPGPTIPITLYDALYDMAPLAEKLGPVGGHPGVVDATHPVHSQILGPDFEVRVVSDSNLRVCDGIDLSAGKEYISVIVDTIGPTFDDELEFDFEDPEKLEVTGLVDSPTMALRFSLAEHDAFVPACFGNNQCKLNMPGNPVGTGTAWHLDPWDLEYIVAHGGLNKYESRVFQECYAVCAAEIRIGMDDNPFGWTEYFTILDIGHPPEDQFIWEQINEIAQVALHNTPYATFVEGTANGEFTLEGIDCGISPTEALDAIRPQVQEQAGAISDLLLGDFRKNNGPVQIYLRRADTGEPFLYFVAPSDLPDGEAYPYTRPGFFIRDDLSPATKVSALDIIGVDDTEHEKWRIHPGELTLYTEDDTGAVYRLILSVPDVPDPTEIGVRVARRGP